MYTTGLYEHYIISPSEYSLVVSMQLPAKNETINKDRKYCSIEAMTTASTGFQNMTTHISLQYLVDGRPGIHCVTSYNTLHVLLAVPIAGWTGAHTGTMPQGQEPGRLELAESSFAEQRRIDDIKWT